VSPEVLRVIGKGNKERLTILTDAAYWAVLDWWYYRCFNTRAVYRDGKLNKEEVERWFTPTVRADAIPLFKTSQKPFVEYKDPGHQIWLRVRELAKEIHIDARPHRFRHSFGTELVDKDVPLQDVADVMGHESIQTTRGYVDRGERGLKAIRQKHSRTEEEANGV
jgi:site-specific recombinase XerD